MPCVTFIYLKLWPSKFLILLSFVSQLATSNHGSGGDKDYVISIALHAVRALFSYYSSFSILRESIFGIIKFEEEVNLVNRHSKRPWRKTGDNEWVME